MGGIMSTTKLLVELAKLGIRLEVDGDRLRYHPRSAVTPALAERLKAHKNELLAILRPGARASSSGLHDATLIWQAVLAELEGDPLFPPNVMEALRAASVWWSTEPPRLRPAEPPVVCRCGSRAYVDV